jgi:lysophospholipase L1-like esterase
MYVALGDSMSIDDYAGGPGRGAASLLYRNHADWPDFAGRDLATFRPDLEFRVLAFDGATSEGVLALQVPTLRSLPKAPRLITLTVGGNDLLTYFGIGRGEAGRAARHLGSRLERILAGCVEAVGGTGCVVVGNIYDPTDGTGSLPGSGFPLWADSLAVLARFNEVIAEVASEFPVQFVDIHHHFLGHGARAQDPTFSRYHAEDPTVWYTQLVEPDARGAHEVRRLFWQAFLRSPLGVALGDSVPLAAPVGGRAPGERGEGSGRKPGSPVARESRPDQDADSELGGRRRGANA